MNHHCGCSSRNPKRHDHSFHKIPSLRKQRLEPNHADRHTKLSYIEDKQAMTRDFQEGRLKVNHEDGKKNIIIIM
jgi:hypothetical protein